MMVRSSVTRMVSPYLLDVASIMSEVTEQEMRTINERRVFLGSKWGGTNEDRSTNSN